MNSIINLTEATLLALHSMALIAQAQHEKVNTKTIAATINASENHLAKVMQRLNKAGLVESIRGPMGGFILSKPGNEISLLDVYEAMEGKLRVDK